MSILESQEFRGWLQQILSDGVSAQFIAALGRELGLTDDQKDIYLSQIFRDFQPTGDSQADALELLACLRSHMTLCRAIPMFVSNIEADRVGLESLTGELLERHAPDYNIFAVFPHPEPDVRVWGGTPWVICLTDDDGEQFDVTVVHSPGISRQAVMESIFWQLFEHERQRQDSTGAGQ